MIEEAPAVDAAGADAHAAASGGDRSARVDPLPQRRHGRVPLRCRSRRLLFHGGECAHPGRASGFRDDHRRRSDRSFSSRSPLADALPIAQNDIGLHGHAIEARIIAEDPGPRLRAVAGPHAELATAQWRAAFASTRPSREGTVVPPFYDSMIAKLIVHAADRTAAVALLREALGQFRGRRGSPPTRACCARSPPIPISSTDRFDTRWLETTFLPSYGQRKEA